MTRKYQMVNTAFKSHLEAAYKYRLHYEEYTNGITILSLQIDGKSNVYSDWVKTFHDTNI